MFIPDERESNKIPNLNVNAFSKMINLRLLRLRCRTFRGHLNYLPNELRLLHWDGYPLKSLPSSFKPDNLVALLLRQSDLKQLWKGTIPLVKLKEIDLSGSMNLIETPDITFAPNVEVLILAGCTGLKVVHSSIGLLKSLKLLNLRGCQSLRKLPTDIRMESLEKLTLSDCSNLERFPEIIGKMERLIELNLDRSGIEELPSGVGGCKNLETLTLSGCPRLEAVHPSIGMLKTIKLLNLKGCRNLRSFPAKIDMESLEILTLSDCRKLEGFLEIGKMECLLELNLDRTGIEGLHSIGNLDRLVVLDLNYCRNLISVSTGRCNILETLNLCGCTELKDVDPSIGLLKRVKLLNLKGCKSLTSLEKLTLSGKMENGTEIDGKMERLLELHLDGTEIKELPDSIGNLDKLVLLNLKGCRNLIGLPKGVGECQSLETLNLSGCTELKDVDPSIGLLKRVKLLDLEKCKNLTSFPTKLDMESLEILTLSGCWNLEGFLEIGKMECLLELNLDRTGINGLHSIGNLDRLVVLNLNDCRNLIGLSIGGCKSLKTLNLSRCRIIENLPENLKQAELLEELDLSGNNFCSVPISLTRLSKLRYVDFSDCRNLESLPELLTTVATLKTNGCASLERIANPSKACFNSTESASFSGVSCYKLVENMNAITLLKKHLKVFANSRKQFDIIMPGSEIPEWFSPKKEISEWFSPKKEISEWFSGHMRVESSSSIKLQFRNGSQWMGVAFCCIFVDSLPFGLENIDFRASVCYRNSGQTGLFNFGSNVIGHIEKNHIFLRYLSRDCFNQEWDKHELTIQPGVWANNVNVKVKLGVRMVCQKDLEDTEAEP